jgi:hypothetical protein
MKKAAAIGFAAAFFTLKFACLSSVTCLAHRKMRFAVLLWLG